MGFIPWSLVSSDVYCFKILKLGYLEGNLQHHVYQHSFDRKSCSVIFQIITLLNIILSKNECLAFWKKFCTQQFLTSLSAFSFQWPAATRYDKFYYDQQYLKILWLVIKMPASIQCSIFSFRLLSFLIPMKLLSAWSVFTMYVWLLLVIIK